LLFSELGLAPPGDLRWAPGPAVEAIRPVAPPFTLPVRREEAVECTSDLNSHSASDEVRALRTDCRSWSDHAPGRQGELSLMMTESNHALTMRLPPGLVRAASRTFAGESWKNRTATPSGSSTGDRN